MVQSIFGGATSYQEQSLKNIIIDINRWIDYTISTRDFLQSSEIYLKSENYWHNIPFNFQMTLLSSITQQNTYLEDFNIILKSINNDSITDREINLLHKIGSMAISFNSEYGKTYKEDSTWKDYENPMFKVAEDMYCKGRDYFVTMQDATNASIRLQDYSIKHPIITQNNITQNISRNSGQVVGISNGNLIQNKLNSNSTILDDIKSAVIELNKSSEIDSLHKDYINNILTNTASALNNDDIQTQNTCKAELKAFLFGAGDKALKVVGILSSFASLASFFGVGL